MEYIEPLLTCDKILDLFTAEGRPSSILSSGIYQSLGGKANTNITQALNRLTDIDRHLLKHNDYYSLSGMAKQFISQGKYKGMCESLQQQSLDEAAKRRLELEQFKSVIATNNAVQKNIAFQERLGRITLILGAVSTVFILVTILQECSNRTERQLQNIQSELEQSKASLDSIRLSLEKINASMSSGAEHSVKGR